MTATSSHPSSPQLSRICLVACTSNGTVEYSHFGMDRPYALSLPARSGAARSGAVTSSTSGVTASSTSGGGGTEGCSSWGTWVLEMAASAAATSASPRSSISAGGSCSG